MAGLIHCVYSSVASSRFDEADLPVLLKHARIANAAIGVTGMLVYINGHFLQVIEGAEDTVNSLIVKISKDPRHKKVFVIVREPIIARAFTDWSMGFEALLPADVESLVGENDFFDSAECMNSMDPGVVKAILTSFRKVQTATS